MVPILLGSGITISATRVPSGDTMLGIVLGITFFGLIVIVYLLYKFFKNSRFQKEMVMRAEIAHEYSERRKEEIQDKRKKTIEAKKADKKEDIKFGTVPGTIGTVGTIEKEPWPEYVPEKHLKEDEKQIVNILKTREGKCEQGTLRVVSGMPKSSLSRILKELEERNIIHKEKRGKKNMVFLR